MYYKLIKNDFQKSKVVTFRAATNVFCFSPEWRVAIICILYL
jgi:hypothetical protein